MYKKALELLGAVGLKDAMVNDYGNLGIVYEKRGDPVQAEAMYQKANELFEGIGAVDQVKFVDALLAKVHSGAHTSPEPAPKQS
jgi:hypothetical protein